MAKAKKAVAKKASANSDATVVRISASDDQPKATKAPKQRERTVVKKLKIKKGTSRKMPGIILAFFGYFRGAWQELKLVRWPTRKATWGLTIAVLLFSAFFVVFILLIDAGFKYLFEVIYKQ